MNFSNAIDDLLTLLQSLTVTPYTAMLKLLVSFVLGAIVGFGLGFLFYFNIFRNFLEQILNIKSSILYWIICYVFATFMFWFLKPIYPENKILNIVLNFWDKFFAWALSVS